MNDTASLFDTEALLSDGIKSTPPSFVRSILKAASDPNVTSFAGGLPNPISFPEDELLKSMERVVAEPVSYTHLDVYKRQSFHCRLVRASRRSRPVRSRA